MSNIPIVQGSFTQAYPVEELRELGLQLGDAHADIRRLEKELEALQLELDGARSELRRQARHKDAIGRTP